MLEEKETPRNAEVCMFFSLIVAIPTYFFFLTYDFRLCSPGQKHQVPLSDAHSFIYERFEPSSHFLLLTFFPSCSVSQWLVWN